MVKICTIVGARPQFIKAATVSRAVSLRDDINEVIIHTGQHYDKNMSEQFFDELNIPKPDYNLNVGSGGHGAQTGKMLQSIEEVLLKEKPDYVLVYGDTNSTLAGALAAVKIGIPIAHVEAGLRSFNMNMPEEINRKLTDHISSLLFCPNENSYHQLLQEGISEQQIFHVGDVMYDAVLFYNEFNSSRQTIVDTLNLKEKAFSLATIHRAENTDSEKRLGHIVNALLDYGKNHQVVMPLHPRTKVKLEAYDLLDALKSTVQLVEPLGYLDMLALENQAQLVITDSGGVQKEAYFSAVPCVTLRDETEWLELVDLGWNKLCSPEERFAIPEQWQPDAGSYNNVVYGRGDAAINILNQIVASCRHKELEK